MNKCIGLIPPFTDSDVDRNFVLFERVARSLSWRGMLTLLFQCVFTGNTQEAYASLSPRDRLESDKVKRAVEKASELVPADSGRVKTALFYFVFNIKDFDQLCETLLLEEFKIYEQKATKLSDAAALADDYVLTRNDYSGFRVSKQFFG